MEFIERTLEASSLFLAAELLERQPQAYGPYIRIHPEHISRLRAVATRISLEIEESRLRRDIEREDPQGLNPLYRESCSKEELDRMGIELHLKAGPGTYFLIHPRAVERVELGGVADLAAPSSNGKHEYSDLVAMQRYLELDRCLDP